ncbi:MAG: helix-turn-helix domain-containing protein, partial [Alphaproteobacteria bacterium]
KKAEQLKLPLSPEVAMYLADGIASNVRELEGALNRLAAHASMTGAAITVDFAHSQLRDLFRANTRVVTIEDIQQKVTEHFDVRMSDLLGSRRLRQLARPRQVAMYLAKKYTSKSYPDIGRAFGGRDHTTVIHAVRTVENLVPRDKELAEKVQLLERIFGSR